MFRFLERLGAIGILSRDFFRCLTRRPFEFGLIIEQLDELGVRSLNIVNLTAIFTGMVLALQMGQLLSRFGAKVYVSRLMGLSLFREMGPVLTALLVAGRVGSGISAELGSMQVTDQIDAMRSLATNPIKKLVMPRVLATILIMPVLTIFADAVGLLGGLAIAVSELGLTAGYFFSSLTQNTQLRDVFSGLGKSVVFGYLIAIIACQNGLDVTGGADGVGRATTSTVVTASVSILVADFFLTKLLMSI
ncbi:MAG: MlaE family ABC transporter permease [Candidatus Binataceae bacterium]